MEKTATHRLTRAAELDAASIPADARTVGLSFSSEAPVLRRDWDGERFYEVLDHSKVDSREISDGAPLLFGHNDNFHIGTVESVAFTGNRGRAVVRFGRSALAEEKFQDVKDGILKKTSVGYDLSGAEPVEDGQRDGIPVIRFRNWKPMEVTLCPLPADNSVGVGRDADDQRTTFKLSSIMKRSIQLDALPTDGGNNKSTAPAVITKEDFTRDLDTAREIYGVALHYQRTHPEVADLAEKAVTDGTNLRDFLAQVREITSKESTQRAAIIPSKQEARGSRSVGGRFVESEAYKAAAKRGIGKGNHISIELPEVYSMRTDWAAFKRGTTFGIGTSDISTSTDIGGTSGANIDQIQTWNPLNQQPLAVADLFSQGTTSGDVVRYVRELTFTNAADRVAEANAIPQQSLDVGVINATVEKTAAYLDVTREMLNDWGQASSFINSRLAYAVQAKEDNFLLNGTGSSQITGILNFSGIQTLSGATNTIDQLLRAKAYVEGANGAGFSMPDAYVMNPLDFLAVRITKDSNGQYLFGGPAFSPYGVGGFSNVGMLWGLPVVTTTFLSQGTAVVGAFRTGAQIFRRQGVVIETTDSDGSKFLSDIFTIRATSRFTLACYQPNRFCTITNLPA